MELLQYPDPPKPMLSTEELAKYLGVTVQTVYGWNKRKYGPVFETVSNICFYSKQDIKDWLESGSGSLIWYYFYHKAKPGKRSRV